MRGRRWAWGAVLLVVTFPATALAQSPGPGALPSAVAMPTDAHAGWTLHQGTDPAFSILLPPGWVQDGTSDHLLDATLGPDGTLRLDVTDLPAASLFQAYVTGQEADAEQQTGRDVAMTMRQVGTGLVARLELPPAPGSGDPGLTQVRYLYPACDDHAVTLTIGATLAPGDATTRDQWDDIAANVDPCAADPAPVRVLDPAVQLLAYQYLAVAAHYNDQLAATYAPLADGASLRQWKRRMTTMTQLERGLVQDISLLDWTPELLPLADAVIAADGRLGDVYQRMADAKTIRAVQARLDDQAQRSADAADATDALRLALGLSTNPR